MIELPDSITAVVTVNVTTPAPQGDAAEFLAAIALFTVEIDGGCGLRFSLKASAEGSEAELIEWASRHFPERSVLLGYQLDTAVVPALLEAACQASPEVAVAFSQRLARCVSSGAIDFADRFGGAGAPPLEEVLHANLAQIPSMSADELFSNWAIDRSQPIAAVVAAMASALWAAWLQSEVRSPDDYAFAELCLLRLAKWQQDGRPPNALARGAEP